jgi:hypothetical protein
MKLLPKITDIKLNRSLKYLTLGILCGIYPLKCLAQGSVLYYGIYVCVDEEGVTSTTLITFMTRK